MWNFAVTCEFQMAGWEIVFDSRVAGSYDGSTMLPAAASMNSAVLRLFAALLVLIAASASFAQGYPVRAIRVIVPYPAGGTTDVLARTVGEKLTEAWGQPIIVDNRSGAGGLIGTEAAAKSAPDGYTLVLGNNQTHAANAALFDKVPFDLLRDFQPVAMVATSRHVIVVPAASSAKSIRDLVALGRGGKKLAFASSSAGSASHLISEMLRIRTGMDAVHVPYRGANPAVTDLLGGQVDFMTATYASVAQFIEQGKLRALAIGGEGRIARIADVPTLKEAGFDYLNADAWFAYYAPAGTPRETVDKLNAEVNRALRNPGVVEKLRSVGFEPLVMSVEEFGRFHRAEFNRWNEMVRVAGVKLNP